MRQHTITKSLAVVMTSKNGNRQGAEAILPQSLLQSLLQRNEDGVEAHYFIRNMERISSSFPQNENIYILGHEVAEDFPMHTHDFFELSYVCRGELLHVIDGVELYMRQGDVILLNKNALQEIRCLNPQTMIVNVCMKENLFSGTLKNYIMEDNPVSEFLRYENAGRGKFMFFSTGCSSKVPIFMNNLVEEYTEAQFHQTYSLEAWLLLLLDSLAKSGKYSYHGIDKRAMKVLSHVQENCTQHTLEEMAAQLGYNANYLTGYIKRHTGRNCRDIMREARLAKALELLAESTMTIYDVSEACGYSSPSHFFRIFREACHMSPKEYREQNRKSSHLL